MGKSRKSRKNSVGEKKPRNKPQRLDAEANPSRPDAPPPLPPEAALPTPELPRLIRFLLNLSQTQFCLVLGVILVGCFALRISRLTTPESMMFDEIYWGFTAQEIVNGNPSIYDPYAKPPAGLAYEWTHPPLGKLLIALGVKAFGPGSFGLRISSVIFGTAAVWLASLIALELFGSYAMAIVTAYLLSIETTGLALSRISMVDVHGLFFMLAGFLEYIRWRREPQKLLHLLTAGFGLGLAAAVKWNSAFLFLILGLDAVLQWGRGRLPDRNWLLWFAATFGVIPVSVYVLSYAHFFHLGNSFEQLRELQQQMWYYHTTLKATHSSSSETWQWILNLKPVWFHTALLPDGRQEEVFAIGNHIILYLGLAAFLWCCRRLTKQWNELLALLCVTYLVLWFPWTFSPRLKFFYHYLPGISFLCIIASFMLVQQLKDWVAKSATGRRPKGIETWLVLATVCTVVLYPFVAAAPVSQSVDGFFRRTAGVFLF